ncbi:hypothetical protein ACVW0J_000655 [Bradyrhizobium sp. i1.7.7]
MGIEGAAVRLHEGLRQRVEAFRGPVPDELVGGVGQRRAEIALIGAPHQRIQPVGRDDQVVAVELVDGVDLRVEARRDAGVERALLEELQELQPADRGEADAVDGDAVAVKVQRDVLPALHMRRDRIDRFGVVGAQEFQGLIGEHDAKAPGRVGRVLFEQVDLILGMTLLPEIGEIEPTGPPANHGDPQRLPP